MLQSLSALADMHQYHQADDQHQAVAEHIHQLDLSNLDRGSAVILEKFANCTLNY